MMMKRLRISATDRKLHSFSDFFRGFRAAASRREMAVTHSSDSDGKAGAKKTRPADTVTFSSEISTESPLYEPPGVSFSEYIKDRPRIFEAMFPDKRRSQRLNDEEWRIQMLPIRFLFASVNPVVDMRLRCKSHGKEYPPSVPLHVNRILELQATRWELKGLEGISVPSHFDLNVQGVLYAVRRGSRSHLKGRLEISISLVLPPTLALVPMDVLKAVADAVLTRLVEKMKQEVDAGLLSDFSNFRREKLAQGSQSPVAATTVSDGNP